MIVQHKAKGSAAGALSILQVGLGKMGTVGAVIQRAAQRDSVDQIFLVCFVMEGQPDNKEE